MIQPIHKLCSPITECETWGWGRDGDDGGTWTHRRSVKRGILGELQNVPSLINRLVFASWIWLRVQGTPKVHCSLPVPLFSFLDSLHLCWVIRRSASIGHLFSPTTAPKLESKTTAGRGNPKCNGRSQGTSLQILTIQILKPNSLSKMTRAK